MEIAFLIMINPSQAFKLIDALSVPKKVHQISIQEALGSILAEDLKADRDFPPFDRAMMDGIAIKNSTSTKWPIESIAFAGEAKKILNNPNAAIEIMTGAPIPLDCDAILKVEDLLFNDFEGVKWAEYIGKDPINIGQFIHAQASDCKENDLIISSGAKIGPVEIAIAATIGKAKLSVFKKPSMVIFSTGDEIVGLDQQPLPHQIRSSNSYMLQAVLQSNGFSTELSHVKDEIDAVENALEAATEKHQIILLSGGVSAGKKDFIPDVLKKLGFEPIFHKIAQKPGKPLYVGKREDGKAVFAFPGNPISTLTCFWIYFLPWLLEKKRVFLEISVENLPLANPNLDQWLPVQIENNLATPLKNNGSGDLIHWSLADGLVWQKAGSTEKSLPFFPLR
jgi:molybdopterin molybdotransferase